MKKIKVTTRVKKMLADVYTPVGIYLRLRDRFRDTILLESTDHHVAENSYSFICINAIAGIEIRDKDIAETKFPLQEASRTKLTGSEDLENLLWSFIQRFEMTAEDEKHARSAQGLYGYFTFEAVRFFETIKFKDNTDTSNQIPVARYRLYQYVIAINHHRDEIILCENCLDGLESEVVALESLINSR